MSKLKTERKFDLGFIFNLLKWFQGLKIKLFVLLKLSTEKNGQKKISRETLEPDCGILRLKFGVY